MERLFENTERTFGLTRSITSTTRRREPVVMAQLTKVIIAVVLIVAIANARLMNKREHIPKQFELRERTDSNQLHEFSLALKQKNLDILEATLLEVSDPESPKYGKWWTREQILDLIALSIDEINPVVSWLKSHNGVKEIDVSGRDVIKVKALVGTIEQMFRTQMHNYRSLETGKIVSRVFGSVHVPDHLDVIDMVTGLTELVPQSAININNHKRSTEQNTDPLGIIYPGHLRKMYQIPSAYNVNGASSFGVAEFQGVTSYFTSDLTAFNQEMNENVVVNKIVGPFNGQFPNSESTLDVQYGASMALNTSFWFWTVKNWMYEFATDLFNAQSYPLVVSMSYGWPENNQCDIAGCTPNDKQGSYAYVNRVNTEYIKIGLKGITLLAASGDSGALSQYDFSCKGIVLNNFPASSPWVTTVGATMLVPSSTSNRRSNVVRQSNQPPICQTVTCATTTLEGVCSYPTSTITSGGGFSEISGMPTWQQNYVNNYLNTATNLPYGQFNASNRAYPDVAVNGHNYGIYQAGVMNPVDGTSASAPVFGAVLSLLNSYLVNHGKKSIGFANPLLYKMYAADKTTYTDITTGNNYCGERCCGSTGYVAIPGWDAVTGLGTPMFPRMQEYLRKNVVEKKN